MTGWAAALAGLALVVGILIGTIVDKDGECERAAQGYFLSVQVSGASSDATKAAGVMFALECDLPLFPAVPTPTAMPS